MKQYATKEMSAEIYRTKKRNSYSNVTQFNHKNVQFSKQVIRLHRGIKVKYTKWLQNKDEIQ